MHRFDDSQREQRCGLQFGNLHAQRGAMEAL
jgi:hypothetical protein